MKTKTLLTLGLLLGAGSLMSQAPYTVHNLEFPFQRGSIAAVDINNDGNRELIITGENPDGRATQIFSNGGNMDFMALPTPITAVALGNTSWGDITGNGEPDLMVSGFGPENAAIANVFVNDNGTYTNATPEGFAQLAPGSVMADFDNDGYTDIAVFGNHDIGNGLPRLYLNDGNGDWDESTPFGDALVIDPEPSVVDYDNDGDLDIFLMAGYEVNSDGRYNRILRNDGNGNFEVIDPELIQKGFGSASWGDYDADGDLDLLLNGDGYLNSGEDNDMIFRLYENNGGDFTQVTTFEPYRQNNIGQGSAFGDWNNDGQLDVIVSGWNPTLEHQVIAVYINNGDGTYTEADGNDGIPGVSEQSIEVADLDNDGDLDLIASGFSNHNYAGEGSAFAANVTYVLENNISVVNEAPSAPTNLQATVSGDDVIFSWDAAIDNNTPSASISYNLFVKDGNGDYILSPLSNSDNGYILKQGLGNVQLNTSWTIKGIASTEYTWGVQAVDNAYLGSEFAMPSVSTENLFNRDMLSVFPNPSAHNFNLTAESGVYDVRIYSVNGKLIESFNMRDQRAEFSLEPGLYILQATNAKGESGIQKLVAQ